MPISTDDGDPDDDGDVHDLSSDGGVRDAADCADLTHSEDEDEDEDGDPMVCKFDGMLINPGTAHITHNATNALTASMAAFGKRSDEMQKVCNLCRIEKHKPRLMETCFGDQVGQRFQPAFKSLKGMCIRNVLPHLLSQPQS